MTGFTAEERFFLFLCKMGVWEIGAGPMAGLGRITRFEDDVGEIDEEGPLAGLGRTTGFADDVGEIDEEGPMAGLGRIGRIAGFADELPSKAEGVES